MRSVFGDVDQRAARRRPHPRAVAGQPARDDGAGAAPGRSRARALRGRQLVAAERARRRATCRARSPASLARASVALIGGRARAVRSARARRRRCARARRLRAADRRTAISARVFRALDELVAARILIADGERYRFSQRGFVAGAARAMPARARARDALAPRRPARAARRRLGAARASPAARRARARGRSSCCTAPNLQTLPAAGAAARARARARRARSACRARAIYELRIGVAGQGVDGARDRQLPRASSRPCSRELERDSGLRDYRELARRAAERSPDAGARARAAALSSTPEHERVYPPIEAIRELARCLRRRLLARAAAVRPRLPRVAAVARRRSCRCRRRSACVAQLVEAAKDSLRGRTLSRDAHVRAHPRARRPARPRRLRRDVVPRHRASACTTARAARGRARHPARRAPRASARVAIASTASTPGACALAAPEPRQRRRGAQAASAAPSSAAAGGQDQRYIGTSASFELLAHADDRRPARRQARARRLTRARARTTRAGGRCADQPVPLSLAAGRSERRARRAVAGVRARPSPGAIRTACYVAAAHVGLLCDLGRIDEAVERGREYYALCQREGLATVDRWVDLAYAHALSRSGEHARRLRIVDEAIARANGSAERPRARRAVRARARIAIWAGDERDVREIRRALRAPSTRRARTRR